MFVMEDELKLCSKPATGHLIGYRLQKNADMSVLSYIIKMIYVLVI